MKPAVGAHAMRGGGKTHPPIPYMLTRSSRDLAMPRLRFALLLLAVALTPGLALAGPVPAPPTGTERYAGTYSHEDAANDDTIEITPLDKSRVQVSFDLSWYHDTPYGRIPNQGGAEGAASVRGDSATFTSKDWGNCVVTLRLVGPDKLEVKSATSPCEFGAHVYADGLYTRYDVSESTTLARALGAARGKAQAARGAAAQARQKIQDLAAKRKGLLLAVTKEKQDLAKHLQAGSIAYKKCQSHALKPSTTAAPAADCLTVAKAEYEAALTLAASLKNDLTELNTLEANLDKQVTVASDAAASAEAAAADAKAAALALQQGSTAARTAAAKTQQDASQMRSQSGFSSLASYNAARVKSEADVVKLDTDVEAAKTALIEIRGSGKGGGSRGPSGGTEVAASEVRQRYGQYADETMQAHPEIVAAMKRFDPASDVLVIANDNRALKLPDGRELLLLSGRTCRACGQVQYWVVWDAAHKTAAFARGDTNVPAYGNPDAAVRAVLADFVKTTTNF